MSRLIVSKRQSTTQRIEPTPPGVRQIRIRPLHTGSWRDIAGDRALTLALSAEHSGKEKEEKKKGRTEKSGGGQEMKGDSHGEEGEDGGTSKVERAARGWTERDSVRGREREAAMEGAEGQRSLPSTVYVTIAHRALLCVVNVRLSGGCEGRLRAVEWWASGSG